MFYKCNYTSQDAQLISSFFHLSTLINEHTYSSRNTYLKCKKFVNRLLTFWNVNVDNIESFNQAVGCNNQAINNILAVL